MEKMKVEVKFVGGKWEEVKKCFSFSFFFSFHWPSNIGTFQGPRSIRPSKGH
jgi:hypothetical protein